MGLRPACSAHVSPSANMGHPSRGWGLVVSREFSSLITVLGVRLDGEGDAYFLLFIFLV
jgi:hypothetical protein